MQWRPEVRRAGIDSMKWPTRQQKRQKLDESLYFRPLHDNGTMWNNPLIRQNVLESELRFRNTDPMPRVPNLPRIPTQHQQRQAQAILQATFNPNELKLNRYTATPEYMVTGMQPVRIQLKTPFFDAYVPAGIQNGGRPSTEAGVFLSI